MRRFVPILLCLVMLFGGLCSGLCLAQTATHDASHSCCHSKNPCGHAAPSTQSHQAVAGFQTMPVVLTQPVLLAQAHQFTAPLAAVASTRAVLSIPFPLNVLRL